MWGSKLNVPKMGAAPTKNTAFLRNIYGYLKLKVQGLYLAYFRTVNNEHNFLASGAMSLLF